MGCEWQPELTFRLFSFYFAICLQLSTPNIVTRKSPKGEIFTSQNWKIMQKRYAMKRSEMTVEKRYFGTIS